MYFIGNLDEFNRLPSDTEVAAIGTRSLVRQHLTSEQLVDLMQRGSQIERLSAIGAMQIIYPHHQSLQ